MCPKLLYLAQWWQVLSGLPLFDVYLCCVHDYEPQHDKANKLTCAPSKDSDWPGHPPSLIRVFPVHMKKLGPYQSIAHTANSDQTGRT